ncbi:MAG: type II toxin-antitoxin system CcdA family antitoxin [Candidatus Aenigmatarchaeota archaeon]
MGKKDTLLTLDEDVVREAKKLGINLSDTAERALKSKVYPSQGEKPFLHLEEYLQELEERNQCFRLPVKVKSLGLENIRNFDSFKCKFGDMTLIKGVNASGKTTILESMAYALRHEEDPEGLLREGKEEGEIAMEIVTTGTKRVGLNRDGEDEKEGGCLMLDDPLLREEQFERMEELIENELGEKDVQIVLTTHRPDFPEKPFDKVIDLGDDHLKQRKENLQEEIKELEDKIEAKRDTLEEMGRPEKKVEEMESEIAELEHEVDILEAELNQLDEIIEMEGPPEITEELEQKKLRKEREISELEVKLGKKKEKLEELKEPSQEKRQKELKLKKDIGRLDARKDVKEEKLEEVEERLDEKN